MDINWQNVENTEDIENKNDVELNNIEPAWESVSSTLSVFNYYSKSTKINFNVTTEESLENISTNNDWCNSRFSII